MGMQGAQGVCGTGTLQHRVGPVHVLQFDQVRAFGSRGLCLSLQWQWSFKFRLPDPSVRLRVGLGLILTIDFQVATKYLPALVPPSPGRDRHRRDYLLVSVQVHCKVQCWARVYLTLSHDFL